MIDMTGRRRKRCKQLLDDVKEMRRHCKLNGEAVNRAVLRTGFKRGYGPLVRYTA